MIVQNYAGQPELGGLYMCAWGQRLEPCVLVGIGKKGNWQISLINYNKFFVPPMKTSIMGHHNNKLVKIDSNILNQEQQTRYQQALKSLSK